jgi:hypothetical protein
MRRISDKSAPLLAAALEYYRRGFAVTPLKVDGKKSLKPAWQTDAHPDYARPGDRVMTPEAIRADFSDGSVNGVGLIMGSNSGGIVALDIETGEAYRAFLALEELDGTPLGERLALCPVSRTPGGGAHILIPLEFPVPGNKAFSWRIVEEMRPDGEIVRRKKALIETRGQDGQVASPVDLNKADQVAGKRTWENPPLGDWRSNRFAVQEYAELQRLAALLDEAGAAVDAYEKRAETTFRASPGSGGSPYLSFNQDPANHQLAVDLLQGNGWRFRESSAGYLNGTRPGKASGTSATWGFCKSAKHGYPLLKVFTSSTEFEAGKAYSPFDVVAQVRHAGDHRALLREIAPDWGKNGIVAGVRNAESAQEIRDHDPTGRLGLSIMSDEQKATRTDTAKTGLILQQAWAWFMAKGSDHGPGFQEILREAGYSAQTWERFRAAGQEVVDRIEPGKWRPVQLVMAKPCRKFPPIQWLIEGLIPAGRASILSAPPKVGKSSALLALAARLMTGRPIVPGGTYREPISVLWLVAEDALEDQIEPALAAEGISLEQQAKRFHFVSGKSDGTLIGPNDRDFDLVKAHLVAHPEIRLVVVDTLAKFFAGAEGEADSMSPGDTRRIVGQLQALAEETGVAVMIVAHDTKEQRVGITRVAGSIQIAATARSILGLERLETGETGLRPVGSNLPGVKPLQGLAFRQVFLNRAEAEEVAGRNLDDFSDFALKVFQRQEIRQHDFSQVDSRPMPTADDVFPPPTREGFADLVNKNRELVETALRAEPTGLTRTALLKEVMTGATDEKTAILDGMITDEFLAQTGEGKARKYLLQKCS